MQDSAQNVAEVSIAGAAPTDATIENWIAAGKLDEAAAALRQRGDLARAQSLYELSWDFAGAADVARQRGDVLGQLRIALRAGDAIAATALQAYFKTASALEQRQAAQLYAKHRLYGPAAALHEVLGDWQTAQALYRQEEAWLDVARLSAQAGHLSDALVAYQTAQRAMPGDSLVQLQAALGCGRLLLRCGRPEEALPPLQTARRLAQNAACPPNLSPEALLDEIEALLIEGFVATGEPRIAEPLLTGYLARRPQNAGMSAAKLVSPVEFVQQRQIIENGPSEPALLLGRYRLLRQLGAGSLGRVYLAEDGGTRRQVVLKLLPAAATKARVQRDLYRRFCQEAQVLQSLRHPHLIELYDFHAAAGVLAMEYMPTGALHTANLPLPLRLLRRILAEVLDALLVVHAAGVLHRDIKPSNLFVSASGATKLGDFGAASLRELGITQTAGLWSTLAYMAPEQIRGADLSFCTDVYGLAVTAYELCTGRLPFSGPDFIEQHLSQSPPDARTFRPLLPAPWAVLLQTLLRKDPAARCADLETLRAAVLALPTPTLFDESSSERPVASLKPSTPFQAVQPAEFESLLRTPYSEIFWTTDPILGRPLVVERFAAGLLQSQAGVAHLEWLKRLAQLAGPGLQPIIRIDLNSQPSAQVYFGAPSNPSHRVKPPLHVTEKAQLLRLLTRLHAAGLGHGSIQHNLVRGPAPPLFLRLSGCGPLSWSSPVTPAEDLAALESLDKDDSLSF